MKKPPQQNTDKTIFEKKIAEWQCYLEIKEKIASTEKKLNDHPWDFICQTCYSNNFKFYRLELFPHQLYYSCGKCGVAGELSDSDRQELTKWILSEMELKNDQCFSFIPYRHD